MENTLPVDWEYVDKITVQNLVQSYKDTLIDGSESGVILRGAILTVLTYYTTEQEYNDILDELLG